MDLDLVRYYLNINVGKLKMLLVVFLRVYYTLDDRCWETKFLFRYLNGGTLIPLCFRSIFKFKHKT